MPAYTTAQLRSVGIQPASTDTPSLPGVVMLEYEFDGTKRSTVATDTADFYDLPAFAGMIVTSAAITVVRPSAGAATAAIQIGGVSVTGLTAWALNAAAGTKLVKLATAANTVVNTGSASAVRLLIGAAGVGDGKFRVRVWGTLLDSPSGTPV